MCAEGGPDAPDEPGEGDDAAGGGPDAPDEPDAESKADEGGAADGLAPMCHRSCSSCHTAWQGDSLARAQLGKGDFKKIQHEAKSSGW
jgi:hypothetical protein